LDLEGKSLPAVKWPGTTIGQAAVKMFCFVVEVDTPVNISQYKMTKNKWFLADKKN